MSENQESSKSSKSNQILEIVHTMARVGGAFFPPAAAFLEIISPVIEKRQNSWIESLANDFERLKQEVDGFNIEELGKNPVFISTLVNASRAAIATHIVEKHEFLHNAVLNSALSEEPDETRQKMFVHWLDELTVWHVKILLLFEEVHNIPTISLGNSDEVNPIQRDKLVGIIETNHPELNGQYYLILQIINELYQKGLLTNTTIRRDIMTQTHDRPILSPLANEFARFIKSPLDQAEVLRS